MSSSAPSTSTSTSTTTSTTTSATGRAAAVVARPFVVAGGVVRVAVGLLRLVVRSGR